MLTQFLAPQQSCPYHRRGDDHEVEKWNAGEEGYGAAEARGRQPPRRRRLWARRRRAVRAQRLSHPVRRSSHCAARARRVTRIPRRVLWCRCDAFLADEKASGSTPFGKWFATEKADMAYAAAAELEKPETLDFFNWLSGDQATPSKN